MIQKRKKTHKNDGKVKTRGFTKKAENKSARRQKRFKCIRNYAIYKL